MTRCQLQNCFAISCTNKASVIPKFVIHAATDFQSMMYGMRFQLGWEVWLEGWIRTQLLRRHVHRLASCKPIWIMQNVEKRIFQISMAKRSQREIMSLYNGWNPWIYWSLGHILSYILQEKSKFSAMQHHHFSAAVHISWPSQLFLYTCNERSFSEQTMQQAVGTIRIDPDLNDDFQVVLALQWYIELTQDMSQLVKPNIPQRYDRGTPDRLISKAGRQICRVCYTLHNPLATMMEHQVSHRLMYVPYSLSSLNFKLECNVLLFTWPRRGNWSMMEQVVALESFSHFHSPLYSHTWGLSMHQ